MMLNAKVHFSLDCPICGRPMRVPIEMYGSKIQCAHCHATVKASQASVEAAESPFCLTDGRT